MTNLQFEINSPIEPEKLMSYLTDFESLQKFFPAQEQRNHLLYMRQESVLKPDQQVNDSAGRYPVE